MTRNATIDRARIMLAVMVVGVHVDLFGDRSRFGEELFVNHLFRIAVPFFLISTGYFLANKLGDRSRFWVWFRRMAVLYVFWSAFYLPIMVVGHASGHPLLGVLHNLATGFQHLWYMIAALEAALILYATRDLIRGRALAVLCAGLYAIGLILEYGGALGGLGRIGAVAAAHPEVYRNALFVGLPMMALGIGLKRFRLSEAAAGRLILVGLATGVGLLAMEFGFNLHRLLGYHLDLLAFLPVFCPALFLACLRYPTSGGAVLPFAASAIYFLHPAVIFALKTAGWPAAAGSVTTYAVVVGLTALAALPVIAANRVIMRRTSYSVL